MADLARSIAADMSLSPEIVEGIRIAAVIHDIGKVSVPAEILSKPGKLTRNELELIKDHPLTGFDILKDVEFPWPVAEIVYQHHERLDGSGYPRGLKGDDVLLEARIIALADVVEAIASHRPFRPAQGIDVALGEITKNTRGPLRPVCRRYVSCPLPGEGIRIGVKKEWLPALSDRNSIEPFSVRLKRNLLTFLEPPHTMRYMKPVRLAVVGVGNCQLSSPGDQSLQRIRP